MRTESALLPPLKEAAGFDERLHPRDRHGRWIHLGVHVEAPGGERGTITGISGAKHVSVDYLKKGDKYATAHGHSPRSLKVLDTEQTRKKTAEAGEIRKAGGVLPAITSNASRAQKVAAVKDLGYKRAAAKLKSGESLSANEADSLASRFNTLARQERNKNGGSAEYERLNTLRMTFRRMREQLTEVDSALLPPLKNSPTKTNWWEKVGGLPDLVTRIAKHLVSERGKTEGTAIATAISQVRKVCATGRTFGGRTGVHPDTKAEYCKAAAEIEAKRAAAKAKSVAEMTAEDAASLALAASAKLGVLAEELGPDFIWGAIRERDVSAKERKKLASKGQAMKDGSFPIANVGDLKNAMRAIGRAPAGKRAAVRAHIKRRAKALKATNLVSEDWAMVEAISEEIVQLNAIVEVFADPSLEEAFVIPTLSTLRSTVRANRRADATKSKSKSKSSNSSSGQKRAPAGSPIGGQFIGTGASGSVVSGIQKRLGIKTTGTFGGKTKSAIEEFQKRHDLTVDGIIGKQTATALLSGGKRKVAVGSLTTGIKSRLKHRFG